MATKLDRKTLPPATTPDSFIIQGRPAKTQDDFGSDVGIADMVCVNQFGEANNAKYYHAAVVKSGLAWFVYLEWGRIVQGQSWAGSTFRGGDYQFVACSDEADARKFFQTQCRSKNIKRLVQKNIAGASVWTAKEGDDGYLVQDLATRTRGLPDAYKIVGASVAQPVPAPIIKTSTAQTYQAQVLKLAQDLVGGVRSYTRSLSQASGVVPTLDAIRQVRDSFIPAALLRLQAVGPVVKDQCLDKDLQALSKAVAALVPRPIPRQGLTDEEAILNANTIPPLEQDLDAFESSLSTAPAVVETVQDNNPFTALNANLTWIDPASDLGKWIYSVVAIPNRTHPYLGGDIRPLNLFEVNRSDRDARFQACAERVGAVRKGNFTLRANMQPATRPDLGSQGDLYGQANVVFTQHGTRSVNVAPILQGHFKLPTQLKGVPIAGANFGHGCYSSLLPYKAAGYTSLSRSAWGQGGGGIQGRGAMMFLTDMVMGNAYRAPSTGSWTQPPAGYDCVYGVGGDRGHQLAHDELVAFNPDHLRIRYLVEFTI